MKTAWRRDALFRMRECTRLAIGYTEGFERVEFLSDIRTQQAVIMNLVIIGEIATKIIREHPEFIAQYPEIPWSSMKGMRNRIAHGYFEIDLDIVWDTVTTALPDLELVLTNVIDLSQPQ